MPVAGANGFLRLTLPELIRQAQADINANLPNADARLPQSNLDVLAISTAGLADEQLDAIDFHARQIHVTTATGDVGLGRHASEWGIPRKESTQASGELAATVTGGNPLRAGALFQTQTQIRVITTTDGVISGGVLVASCQAVEAGITGNLDAGTILTTVNPIPGVMGAIVTGDMRGGTDREQQEPWRGRILDRIQRPPQGGAEHDYVRWALEFPGVTRAWCFPKEQGIGTVVVRFAMDNNYPGGIPGADDAIALLRYIEMRRPVTAEVFVHAPVAAPINVTIRDLTPRTPDIERAIEDELQDMLFREGEPGGTLCINWFWEAVSIASGVRCHKIELPADDVALQIGELPLLGDVEYLPVP